MPKVAVITRTRDRPVMLRRAIKSVHQQTMTDFVHVIINDSGDPAVVDAIVEEFASIAQGRIKVIHNRVSEGMEAASNKAIKSVDSQYIAIHDDDDTWHPDFLLKTTERLDENNMMGVVVTTDRILERVTRSGSIKFIGSERFNSDIKEINLYQLFKINYATPITFLYRRSVFDKIGYYDEELKVCGDWDFALRFAMLWDIDYIDSPHALAFYHHRPDATGINGNSVFAGRDTHRHFGNLLANRYLRRDLQSGNLGFGYIFNVMRREDALAWEKIGRLDDIIRRVTNIEEMVDSRINPDSIAHRAKLFTMGLPKRLVGMGKRAVRERLHKDS